MNPTLHRPAAMLLALTLAAVVPTAAAAQDDALDQAVAAVGGADALSGLTGFVVESIGTRGALD